MNEQALVDEFAERLVREVRDRAIHMGDAILEWAYIASGGWVMRYSQERCTDDFGDLPSDSEG